MKEKDKVVCISANFSSHAAYITQYPVKGEIYTIREVTTANGKIGYLFEEIQNPKYHFVNGYLETAFNAKDFRPIDYSIGEKVCEYITKECEKSKTPETV